MLETNDLNLYYGNFHALKGVTLAIPAKKVTAIIGPSGCGKSTLLRVFNRMNDLVKGVRVTGRVTFSGKDIYAKEADLSWLRERVGMVFQKPNPFPLSIFENVAYGVRIHGLAADNEIPGIIEGSLKKTGLWEALKDRLDDSALSLSPEQRQRLCISRLLAMNPEVLLMDEPCSALDPVATAKIEELMFDLKEKYTIVIVTHNMQQAARVSSATAYMLLGRLIEFGDTAQVFTKPSAKETEDYITGRYG